MLSIVIPVHNEEHSILPLYDRLTRVLVELRRQYEILFVDDASNDRSFELLANLVQTDPHLKVLRLRRNFGQTAALAAGFHEARGKVVIAMDGDLQHAPEDIPALLAKIDEGYDLASGWRKERVDNAIMRKIPSRIANWLMSKASGVDLHDFGTTFKAYRAEILKDVQLYGELHRFIPALASFYGARIAEVPSRLSKGVLSQNNASAAVSSRTNGNTLVLWRNPTPAAVTMGTSSSPQAPCSRGTINARLRSRRALFLADSSASAACSHPVSGLTSVFTAIIAILPYECVACL